MRHTEEQSQPDQGTRYFSGLSLQLRFIAAVLFFAFAIQSVAPMAVQAYGWVGMFERIRQDGASLSKSFAGLFERENACEFCHSASAMQAAVDGVTDDGSQVPTAPRERQESGSGLSGALALWMASYARSSKEADLESVSYGPVDAGAGRTQWVAQLPTPPPRV